MKIEIRKATTDDFEDVYDLIVEFATFIKTPEKVKITSEQMISDQHIFNCLIVVHDKEIIGFATYFFSYYSWSGKAIYLDDLFIRPDYRGQGIGSLVFDHIKEIGEKEDCFKMRWQVSKWNDKAQEFYKRKGALIDKTEINCDLILN